MFTQYKRSWIHRISYTKKQLIWKDVYSTYSLFGILLFYPHLIFSRNCKLSRWVWVKSRLNRSGWRYLDWLLCLYTIKWSIRSSVRFEALENPSKEGRYHLQRKWFIQWFEGKRNLLKGVIYLIECIVYFILKRFNILLFQENYAYLNNNNYSNKQVPNSTASVLNGNLGSSNRGPTRMVEDLYAKVKNSFKSHYH